MIDERADSDWANLKAVAPFTGAWIEMVSRPSMSHLLGPSHPSRVRGLKCTSHMVLCDSPFIVAPFTGAWIEIVIPPGMHELSDVAPFTGAWIEIAAAIGDMPTTSCGRTLHGCVD